ncbi:MAG: ATP-binding cassette domain-containing protein, partial [Negativicutes bacterium]|nr:ATP-binding cassette domain-containing protein [Negativicutes bacterium]
DVYKRQMSLGEMFAFLIYIINVPAPVRKLTEAAGKLRLGMVAWQRIDRLFAEPTIGPEAGRCQDKLSGQISFERVRFSYTPDRPVLNDLTLSIGRGEFVIIAGASGAGKSTLANLLLRFYDPDGGRICLDGRPVADWQIHSLRRQIGFIQQDALLFACTILENIRYGRPDASLAEVQAAARVANAHDFIVDFPVGYNTRVSEGGSNLSGGQRQRIAIARAVLLNPPILLLDEPTAMLDSQAERQVMQAVRRAGTGRTTILITHRLSVIQPNDRVVYLDGGRVAEQGIYSQLMAANGPFARAVRFWQQNGEKEKPT